MKISQIQEVLEGYPQTAILMVTWEGIFREISKGNIYQSPNGVVVIDADDNLYKPKILSGEKVPR